MWTDGRTYGRTFFPTLILLGRLLEVDLKMMPLTERALVLALSEVALLDLDHGSVTEITLPFHSVMRSTILFCFGDTHVVRIQSFISFTSATLPTAHNIILLYQLPICLLVNIETSPFHENNVAELVSFSTRPFLLFWITSPYDETF